MEDKFQWTVLKTYSLISSYETLPALRDVKSDVYKDRNVKRQNYESLVAKKRNVTARRSLTGLAGRSRVSLFLKPVTQFLRSILQYNLQTSLLKFKKILI